MKNTFIISALSLMMLTFSGCLNCEAIENDVKEEVAPVVEEEKDKPVIEEVDKPAVEVDPATEYDYSAPLEDVSGGTASGEVFAKFFEEKYVLEAKFEDLPKLEEGFFYEGWIVRSDPLSVKSTGRTYVKTDGTIANEFMSDTDYTDHDFYVLTLEPDDGDPAPAGHILEGTMKAS